jgi:hypothetical protein
MGGGCGCLANVDVEVVAEFGVEHMSGFLN